MNNTINYKFKKPEGTDLVDINDLNFNFDIIDDNLKKLNDKNTISGNSGSSSKLEIARKINGVNFDGTKDITIADNTKLPTSGGKLTGDLMFDIIKNGQSKGINWEGLTDGHCIYVEEYDNQESTRLVISNKDNGDTDYTVFRNNGNGNGTGKIKDVFEIHNSFVKSNSQFTVESIDGQINAKKGNNLAVLTTSSTNGEYLVGGKNADDNSDFIKHYVRIGSNKLQYCSNAITKNIILDDDPRLTNSRIANGGTSTILGNAYQITNYDTFNPITVNNILKAQGNVLSIKAGSDAHSPWSNTTTGLLYQSNGSDSYHLTIFRSGGDGYAYRSFYQNKWNDWKIVSFNGHKHSKVDITDMPTKVSQFTNDIGFITAKDVDTSQNHIHGNKSIIDAINQTNINNWNNASNHVGDNTRHITSNERTLWNSVNNKFDKNGGNLTGILGISKNLDIKEMPTVPNYNVGIGWNKMAGEGEVDIYTSNGTGNTYLNLYRRENDGSLTLKATFNKDGGVINGNTLYHTGNKPNKSDIGLNNVDNTKDLDKPISKLVQSALNSKSNNGHKHSKNEITDMPNSLPANGGNSDTVDGLHSSSFFRRDTSNDVDVRLTSSDGRGIRFWDSDDYKISMSSVGNNTFGGRIAGETTSDYNMYFKMSGGNNRGFVFKNNANIVAGIDGDGNIRAKGCLTVGDNKAQIKYNSNTESMDFVFQ